eukprot:7381645-Prymnesium_polylepis.1
MLSTNPLDPYSIAKPFNFIAAVNSKIHRPPCLTELELPAETAPAKAAVQHRDTEQERRRPEAIVFRFVQLGEPPEELWRHGTLSDIGEFIDLEPDKYGKHDYRPIKTVLRHYLNEEPLAWHGGGRAPKLSHGEALVAADCLERGTGREQASYILSKRHAAKGIYGEAEAKVSAFAIRTAFKGLGGVTQKRGTTSTGSHDTDSPWAVSSLAQCTQFNEEIVVPERFLQEPTPDPSL